MGRLTRPKGTALLAQVLTGTTVPGFTVVGDGPAAGELHDSNVLMAGALADLVTQLRWAEHHPEEMAAMGRQAREKFAAQFSPEHVYRQQIAIYEEAREAAADCARQPAGV